LKKDCIIPVYVTQCDALLLRLAAKMGLELKYSSTNLH
jgi:hypothetical protein